MAEPRPEPGTPLYVHLPFCAAKCPYCDFFSVAPVDPRPGPVLDGLLAEARIRAPRLPRTVFLGGGTPSIHAPDELARLLDGLQRITGFRDSAVEVTVECNPESLDREKARCLVELGVDRLTIGFQSLRPATLELFGRVHSVEQSLRAFDAARGAGVARIGIDLIFAAPGQTLEEWNEDLDRVLDLGPEHLSAYCLAFEKGTPFARWRAAGQLQAAPEELELALFRHTRRVAKGRGFQAYEVSNFALNGEHCRHNVHYWRNGPYVGLGPSAVSKQGSTRRGNPPSIEAWLAGLERPGMPPAWSETPPARVRLGETWWLGLRLAEGVVPERARRAAGYEGPRDPALPVAQGLGEQGLLAQEDGAWRLTERGLPLADAVAARFLRPDP